MLIYRYKRRGTAIRRGKAQVAAVSPSSDDSTAWCVGVRNINVNQRPLAEVMRNYAYYKAKKIKKGT
jgi:ferric-dicitrate binding protein FerR (iron transport regulator)